MPFFICVILTRSYFSFIKTKEMETLKDAIEIKAQKNHSCNFCGCKIQAGNIYLKSTHIFDGKIYDWKTHKECSKIASDLNMYDQCEDGVTQDDFVETINQEYFDLMLLTFNEEDREEMKRFSDVINHLSYVEFKKKLHYVIQKQPK